MFFIFRHIFDDFDSTVKYRYCIYKNVYLMNIILPGQFLAYGGHGATVKSDIASYFQDIVIIT